jgi:hypothetical protein
VAESAPLAKAQLQELDADFENQINPDRAVAVQFNPETLKVSFANQLQQPQGAGDQKGTPARQFVGAGTTKLSLQLWFDASAPGSDVNDVRLLTKKVSYFITPKPNEGGKAQGQLIPPAVRFLWGSFQFDGILESIEENLEYFSPEGRPLRASMALALSQQKIVEVKPRAVGPTGGGGRAAPGTRPLTQAPAGSTLQGLASRQGQGGDWQNIAAANGIENPRVLQPGQLIDLNARRMSR